MLSVRASFIPLAFRTWSKGTGLPEFISIHCKARLFAVSDGPTIGTVSRVASSVASGGAGSSVGPSQDIGC